MMTATDTRFEVLRDQADALIRAEIRGLEQRRNLERAVIESIRHMGASIDEVSAITGLVPKEIHRILRRSVREAQDEVEVLAGTG